MCDGLKLGMRYRVLLDLPDSVDPIRAYADVVTVEEGNVCRCRFVDPSDDEADRLHRCVLRRQKLAIQALRANQPD